jgi:hypothetical protein
MSFEKLQEEFFNKLVELGFTEKKAVETTSHFFFSWVKTVGEGEFNSAEYSKRVDEFLSTFKQIS